jgi:hypothetical protein
VAALDDMNASRAPAGALEMHPQLPVVPCCSTTGYLIASFQDAAAKLLKLVPMRIRWEAAIFIE